MIRANTRGCVVLSSTLFQVTEISESRFFSVSPGHLCMRAICYMANSYIVFRVLERRCLFHIRLLLYSQNAYAPNQRTVGISVLIVTVIL